MYYVIAILAIGILIALHEFGHFTVAKLCGVKVNEFSIGMGPLLLKKQGKETMYSLRLLPIGGYCAMEGEDEDTGDERAFTRAKVWKKALILIAGSGMNFLIGFLIVAVIFASSPYQVTTNVVELVDGFQYADNGILPGDRIYSIDGHRTYYSADFTTYMSRAGDTVDMVVIRDGQKVTLKDYGLKPAQYADGYRYGVSFATVEGTFWENLKYSAYTSWNFVRIVWISLQDLVTGRLGLRDMSGIVGIVDTIHDVGEQVEQQTQSVAAAVTEIMYIVSVIAVNLAVMNMLPIPALDGGRVFFLLINLIAEKLFRRRIDPKYEGYVHAGGMIALIVLMVVIMVSDIIKFVR